MKLTAEVVYVGRDNEIELELRADDEAQDLMALTRVMVVMGSLTVDSDDAPTAFDWLTDTTKLVLKFGHVTGLSDHLGRQPSRLIVFSPDYPNGLVWTEALSITVKA